MEINMYVRPPSKIKLPENYGGSAFSSGAYNDMPPPARQSAPPPLRDVSKTEPPPAKSSPLANSIRQSGQMPPSPQDEQYDEPPVESDDELATVKEEPAPPHKSEEPRTSLFSSLLPRSISANGFPFGHGIGTEELLILGIMLLVYLSDNGKDETDNELILLLGLLLFAG